MNQVKSEWVQKEHLCRLGSSLKVHALSSLAILPFLLHTVCYKHLESPSVYFSSLSCSTHLFQMYLPNQDCKCSCVLKQEQPSFQVAPFLTLPWPGFPSKFMPAHFLITPLSRLPSHCQYPSCMLILSYTCTWISNCSTGRYFSVCTCL